MMNSVDHSKSYDWYQIATKAKLELEQRSCTLNCLISVGYHLELHIEYCTERITFTQLTLVCMHTEEHDIT